MQCEKYSALRLILLASNSKFCTKMRKCDRKYQMRLKRGKKIYAGLYCHICKIIGFQIMSINEEVSGQK